QVAIRPSGKNGADIGAVFALARALREAGVTVQLVGLTNGPGREIVASADGFSLAAGDGKARRLTRVDEVVRAVADAGHDEARAAGGSPPRRNRTTAGLRRS